MLQPLGYTSVYFEGLTEKGTFKMGWISTFFRRATVEFYTLTGAVLPGGGGGTSDEAAKKSAKKGKSK